MRIKLAFAGLSLWSSENCHDKKGNEIGSCLNSAYQSAVDPLRATVHEKKLANYQDGFQNLQDKLASLQEISESTKQFYKREKESIEEALRSEMRRTANNEARVKVLQNEQVEALSLRFL